MALISQPWAVRKQATRRRYAPSILARSLFLPERYARKEEEQYRQGMEDIAREELGLSRAALAEARRQGNLANLVGMGQLGVSGALGAGKLLSLSGLAKTATGGGIPPVATIARGGGTFLGPRGLGYIPARALPGKMAAGGLGPASGGILGPLATGAAGAGAVLAVPFLGHQIGSYLRGERQEREAERERRALGGILPNIQEWSHLEPYIRGEVQYGAGMTPELGGTSRTMGRLYGRGAFSGLARERGWGAELSPYEQMMSQIATARQRGVQTAGQWGRELGLSTLPRAGEQTQRQWAEVQAAAQPTFALDFEAGTVTPTFPSLEDIISPKKTSALMSPR